MSDSLIKRSKPSGMKLVPDARKPSISDLAMNIDSPPCFRNVTPSVRSSIKSPSTTRPSAVIAETITPSDSLAATADDHVNDTFRVGNVRHANTIAFVGIWLKSLVFLRIKIKFASIAFRSARFRHLDSLGSIFLNRFTPS